MAGSSSSSTATTTPSSQNHNPGRERAIEALIDREPQGDYFRAARVVDEAFSIAQNSRPNLITKAALVDQAFALAVHEVDTLAKYDAHLAEESLDTIVASTTGKAVSAVLPPKKVDALTRERIFHYQAKLLSAKLNPKPRSNSCSADDDQKSSASAAVRHQRTPSLNTISTGWAACSPPATLVAALRRVYDDGAATVPATLTSTVATAAPASAYVAATAAEAGPKAKHAFELRQLLQSVSNHSVFHSSSNSSSPDDSHVSKNAQANLERLILNVTKLATDSSADSESALQALLVAILSLSTSPHQEVSDDDVARLDKVGLAIGNDDVDADRDVKAKPSSPTRKREEDDVPFHSLLQVGPLLSLFNLDVNSATSLPVVDMEKPETSRDFAESAASTTSPAVAVADAIRDVGQVDPALLDYFSTAAAVYEERWEIQMARMLARMQTTPSPPPPPAASSESKESPEAKRPDTPLLDLVLSSPLSQREDEGETQQQEQEVESEHIPVVETPTGRDRGGGPDMDESQSSVPASPELRPVIRSDGESNAEAPSPPIEIDDTAEETGNENGDEEDDDEDDDDESSESESDDDDDGAVTDQDEELDDQGEDAEDHDEPYESNSEGMMEDAPSGNEDGEQPDNDEAGDESSSSSESSDDEGIEIGTLSDDDDEAILRQALAMSMAVQQEAGVVVSSLVDGASGETSLQPDSSANLVVISATEDEIQSYEEASSPVGEENLGSEPAASIGEDGPDAGAEEDAEAEESSLPSYPNPPTKDQCSFRNVASSTSSSVGDPDAWFSSKMPVPLVDPAEFGDFGAVPTSHVLLHLLQYAASLVKQHASIESSSKTLSVVVGGMGSSLLNAEQAAAPQPSQTVRPKSESGKLDVTLQLCVASFLLLSEKRNDAIENLLKAIASEQRVARGGDLDCEENNDIDDDSSGMPLTSGEDEEDDPALTLAMNYVEDDAPLSSESLENKGLMRKAAAAAHDAEAMMKSLRKRTDAWKVEVKLLSTLVICTVRMLRQFLQSIVRQSFDGEASSRRKSSLLSVLELHHSLPLLVSIKLSDTLESLTSVATRGLYTAGIGGDEAEFEGLFLSSCLFWEGISLWGECIPLLYPSQTARSEVLKSKMENLKCVDPLKYLAEPTQWPAFPASDIESQVHRLKVLSRRLRVSDLLDGFVSRPIPFVAQDNIKLDDKGEIGGSIQNLSSDPTMSSSLVSTIGDFLPVLGTAGGEIQRLYLALCHRYHARTLLLDGFYAATRTGSDERSASSSSSRTLSTGDLVRVASGPSSALQFDPSNCSDSIALLSGFSDDSNDAGAGTGSVHQRASKVWGTVLSTHQFSPKTGVHRWAVKLDKCERGHVFIGVATAQASTRTYVGGDKFGWGMIGTQALWHDRRKIRGDYGSTFRTGSTIIVTLDTDVGTLSFSSWKDCSTSSSFSLDPLVQNIMSPRRSGQIGGTVDNWGIAFEGLPLDAKLYPAVGLYQRDDRVTLLTVETNANNGDVSVAEVSGGECYYPRVSFDALSTSGYMSRIRHYNDVLTWDGIRYATEALQYAIKVLKGNRQNENRYIVESLLPSLAAAICLLPPSVPVLSMRSALFLTPAVSGCVKELQSLVDQNAQTALPLSLVAGKWSIKAVGLGGSPSKVDEYVLDITTEQDDGYSVGLGGKGQGTNAKSKNGIVKIHGCVQGSLITWIEDWSMSPADESPTPPDSASSSSVSARLSIDGRRLEGVYRSVQGGIVGQLVGVCLQPFSGDLAHERKAPDTTTSMSLQMCGSVLCLAHSHLVTLLGDDAAGDVHETRKQSFSVTTEDQAKQKALICALSRPLLSSASLGTSSPTFSSEVNAMKEQYGPPSDFADSVTPQSLLAPSHDVLEQLDGVEINSIAAPPEIAEMVSKMDPKLAIESGGLGSLRSLCPTEYFEARRLVTCAMLYHCRLHEHLVAPEHISDLPSTIHEDMRYVWRASLRITEGSVRRALSLKAGKDRVACCVEACELLIETSKFFLRLEIEGGNNYLIHIEDSVSELVDLYEVVTRKVDLDLLLIQMSSSTRGGLLRLMALRETRLLADSIRPENLNLTEALLVGLPRQLGRGKADPNAARRTYDKDGLAVVTDLDGTYLSRLPGVKLMVKSALKAEVSSLLERLGMVADYAVSQRDTLNSPCSSDSVVISFLSTFIGQMRLNDIQDILSRSSVLSLLPKVLSAHREAILFNPDLGVDDDHNRIRGAIQHIFRRDVSRAVLRCAVAAFHVVMQQVASSSHDANVLGCFDTCSEILLTELALTVPYIEDSSLSFLADSVSRRSDDEWLNWSTTQFAGQKAEVSVKNSNWTACLLYLRDHGCLHFHGQVPGQPQKPPSKGASSRHGGDYQNKSPPTFAHSLLAHWFDILCTFMHSNGSKLIAKNDKRWVIVLFKFVGLVAEQLDSGMVNSVALRSREGGVLPARFRARVLRLMVPLLLALEPSGSVVDSLFHLAGVASALVTQSQDVEECFVSREAISLLRQLHLPSNARWREAINDSILAMTRSPAPDSGFFCKKIGLLSFLSGSLEAIGRGSFVILKPAASSALSPDQQSSPSSKAHPSGIGGSALSAPAAGATPHHLVGNGTFSVIAGLSRLDASAGIVSNIDVKNGICEVILIARDRKEANPNNASSCKMPSTSHGGRQTLTVRAVRAPLVDVVHAQEMPLFLDSSIPVDALIGSIFQFSLESLLSAASLKKVDEPLVAKETDDRAAVVNLTAGDSSGSVAAEAVSPACPDDVDTSIGGTASPAGEATTIEKEEDDTKSLRSGLLGLSSDLMTLRSCIVLLSDTRFTSALKDRSRVLSKALDLAWPNDVGANASYIRSIRTQGLSTLPIHEATLGHLVTLLRDLNFRMLVMKRIAPTKQDTMMENFRSLLEDASRQPPKQETTGSEQPSNTSRVVPSSRNSSGGTSNAAETTTSRAVSSSTAASNSDDEESEAAATAAAHLREAAIAQMAELGLPRSWSELALRRTGGVNIEAAVTFCLERGSEIERMLAEEQESGRAPRDSGDVSSRGRRSHDTGPTNRLLRQLLEMGFPKRWCAEALAVTGNDVDEALTWILNNGERLSEEDEAMEAGDEEDDQNGDDAESIDEEDEDETDPEDARSEGDAEGSKDGDSVVHEVKEPSDVFQAKPCWTGSVIPLRFISGRAIVDPVTMELTGLPTGGFSSVGTKGILHTHGKWYYEAILETAGCLQIGWADGSFAGHCHADRGDGCGDGPSSWAYDGWRRYRWHATATEWGCRWKQGDVVGCLVDMDERTVAFTLNGQAEEIGMGVAFTKEGFRPCGGVYACVSFNRREKLRFILGGHGSEPFKYGPPSGYRGVGEAVLDAVRERDHLLAMEKILDVDETLENCSESTKRFLCDFSDGDHGHELMAWAHRYYGSDASVHLGSGRSKHASSKSSTGVSTQDSKKSSFLTRRLVKVWSEHVRPDPFSRETPYDEVLSQIFAGYEKVQKRLTYEMFNESLAVAVLLCRKLLLHLLITEGTSFNPDFLTPGEGTTSSGAVKFWNVIEACTSLRGAGWVGEAGAMAISAEAVGLGISSNEHAQLRSSGYRNGLVAANDIDEGLCLPTGGYTQLLSSVLKGNFGPSTTNTCELSSASAEAAMGSDGGGGILAFLQAGLQSAVLRSSELRSVLTAATRRGVRLLSVVEYDGDDFETSDIHKNDSGDNQDGKKSGALLSESKKSDPSNIDDEIHPDARLISFVSGLLLSKPTLLSGDEREQLHLDLFEAWSAGLLSASLPWRMICALTVSGILNLNPSILGSAFKQTPTLARYFGRLQSTVARRLWAERAAVPVCSRYAQALVELLASVQRSVSVTASLPTDFSRFWGSIHVDASTPLPVSTNLQARTDSDGRFWEASECWVSSDSGWEVWTGTVNFLPLEWKAPAMSSVRTLMDGGDGPPMLRVGDTVVRGPDWDKVVEPRGNDDGKDAYDVEKAQRDEAKRLSEKKDDSAPPEAQAPDADPPEGEVPVVEEGADPVEEKTEADQERVDELRENPETRTDEDAAPSPEDVPTGDKPDDSDAKKARKLPSPKLPTGVVIAVEPWNGVPAMARRVKWNLTGVEGVYRFGGDGGLYDLVHVEVNSKGTRIKKRHPLPESAEQCAARHGFGTKATHTILLRIRTEMSTNVGDAGECCSDGILEWPDFGSGIRVKCTRHGDGTVSIEESQLLFGSKDSGWTARFGHPSYVPGSTTRLVPVTGGETGRKAKLDSPMAEWSTYEELVGRSTFTVESLRNPADGKQLEITSEMRLYRGRQSAFASVGSPLESPLPPPITFDRDYHAPALSLSRDGRTISCVSSDGGRCSAFASMGFTKGVHYWEVKLEQADIGSVFIGVAEKPIGSGSGSSYSYDSPPRLNRWHGWGFVNFRATYTAGAERIFGSHCHSGDTVGVLLDCDSGRVSFFFDGLKYGEHILNDLGCAFENLSPFGFNVDGCGSGGAGQGAPSGFESGSSSRLPAQGTIRPRTLWPVIGLRNQGDRVTLSSKWSTTSGTDGVVSLRNIIAVENVLHAYSEDSKADTALSMVSFPQWFITESFAEYQRWISGRWTRSTTRGSGPFKLAGAGLDVDFDVSPLACAAASAALGLNEALLAGDRVKLIRSAGRILELAEEAIVLGTYQGRLYYKIVSQKSEGGSLNEGGGRAWCWDESEVVDPLPFILPSKGRGIALPKLLRFTCEAKGGLRVVYENGAVLRSDLEIFDGSVTLGTIPVGTIILPTDVIDRRINSCGVIRFRVRHPEFGEGWISARIRGGTEELIVEPVEEADTTSEGEPPHSFLTPGECATAWYKDWQQGQSGEQDVDSMSIETVDDFKALIQQSCIAGLSAAESDSILVSLVNEISNFSDNGDSLEIPFQQVASALSFAVSTIDKERSHLMTGSSVAANQAAASVFAKFGALPELKAMLARLALLRAFNRRTRLALPWLPVRPCQEGSAILGGLFGHGTSPDRAGRAPVASSEDSWVQVPSIATKLRALRGILFTSVKRDFVQSIVDATTTPTPLSHDEYELPREIRTVRINRLKAGRAMLGDDKSAKRKYSVYAQLYNETKNWGGAGLRRGYVAKGHGGQQRAFKVKLIGEGVNDYGGPYREAFTDAMAEVIKIDADGRTPLGVLDSTPNSGSAIGENRDLYMFSLNGHDLMSTSSSSPTLEFALSPTEARIRRSFASLLVPRDEASREVEEALVFLGRLTGTAFRHGIPLDIPLPMASVWKALTEEPVPAAEKLRELDELAYRQLEDGKDAENFPLILWQQRMLNAFTEGLGNVLPIEILPLLTGQELRDAMCGNPDVDVDLLKQVVEYEGYSPNDAVIGYFWDTLHDLTNAERKQFLQFVWARNRLPMREADFDAPFKIQKDTKSDQALPSASTCFFTLTLPEYSSQQVLRDKLLFAINNVTTMETDFQTNSAEIAEGYRAF